MTADRDLRGPNDKRLLPLDGYCHEIIDRFDVSGCAVGVVVDQRIVYAKGFGDALQPNEAADTKPASPSWTAPWKSSSSSSPTRGTVPGLKLSADGDTAFGLGAGGSEMLLSLTLQNLVAQGKAGWQTKLGSILTGMPPEFGLAQTSLSQLAANRAKLPGSTCLASHAVAATLTGSQLIESAAGIQENLGQRNPGETYTWSPLTNFLVAEVVRSLGGTSSAEGIVRSHVWDQVGASRSSGYAADGGISTASTGATSTARDLSRLMAAILGSWGPFSSSPLEGSDSWSSESNLKLSEFPESMSVNGEAQQFQVLKNGWIQSTYRNHKRISFGAGSPTNGVSQMILFPDDGFGVVVVCHERRIAGGTHSGSFAPLAIANIAADLLLAVSPTPWQALLEPIRFPFSLCLSPNSGAEAKTVGTLPLTVSCFAGVYGLYQKRWDVERNLTGPLFNVSVNGNGLQLHLDGAKGKGAPLLHVHHGVSRVRSRSIVPNHIDPEHDSILYFRIGIKGQVEGFLLQHLENNLSFESLTFLKLSEELASNVRRRFVTTQAQVTESTTLTTGISLLVDSNPFSRVPRIQAPVLSIEEPTSSELGNTSVNSFNNPLASLPLGNSLNPFADIDAWSDTPSAASTSRVSTASYSQQIHEVPTSNNGPIVGLVTTSLAPPPLPTTPRPSLQRVRSLNEGRTTTTVVPEAGPPRYSLYSNDVSSQRPSCGKEEEGEGEEDGDEGEEEEDKTMAALDDIFDELGIQ